MIMEYLVVAFVPQEENGDKPKTKKHYQKEMKAKLKSLNKEGWEQGRKDVDGTVTTFQFRRKKKV